MKNMFHLILNATIIGLMMISIGIGFLMITDTNNTISTSVEMKADYSTESLRNPRFSSIKGNPEKWIVLSISEDFSTAKVLKEDGCIYYMTIFTADNTSITIEVNGELHEFSYTR